MSRRRGGRRVSHARRLHASSGALSAAPGCPACGAPVNALTGAVEGPDGATAPGAWRACTACEWHDAGTATGRPRFGWVRVVTFTRGRTLDDVTVCGACRDAVVERETRAAAAGGVTVRVKPVPPPDEGARCDECEPFTV
jgi:hypothetical protein